MALKTDGRVLAWGRNNYGQTTVPEGATSGVIAIAAGWDHTVALKGDGNVIAWGWNGFGQITLPPAVRSGISAIAAGGRVTFYRLAGGASNTPNFQAWSSQVFTPEQLADPAFSGPSASPFKDGVANLLKYAFNMNATGPDSRALIPGTGNSGLPSVGLTGTGPATMICVEFLRRKGSGLIYTPKRSSTLEPGSFVAMGGTPLVTSINDDWERVVVQEAANPATLPASFAVVEVRLP